MECLQKNRIQNYWKPAVVSTLLCLACNGASAGVIYNWIDDNVNSHVGPITASIEIDRNYWSLGGALTVPGDRHPGFLYFMTYGGVQNFHLSSPSFVGFDGIDGNAIECASLLRPSKPEMNCTGVVDGLVFGPANSFTFDLVFAGEFLQGSMNVNDMYTSANMSSVGNNWTIESISGDSAGGGCHLTTNDCGGSTGKWALDRSTVPAPATLTLFALGLAGFGWTKRKKV
jgi:hypothetical protein